jgi:hypothetical protein
MKMTDGEFAFTDPSMTQHVRDAKALLGAHNPFRSLHEQSTGAGLTLANWKTFARIRSDSPTNFESKVLGLSNKKHAPLSPATAFASSVLPVPTIK